MKNLVLYSFVLIALTANAQKEMKKANEHFKNSAYVEAIKIYEELANKKYTNKQLYKNLGDCYYFNGNYTKASKWYAKLFDLDIKLDLKYNFRYGQSLKATNNYKKADSLLKIYFKSKSIAYKNSSNYLEDIAEKSDKYEISKVSFNNKYSNYPAFLKNDDLYVVSNGDGTMVNPWNNEPTSDLFLLKTDGIENLGEKINTKYNEGSIALTKDGNTMFFTRNDFNQGKLGTDKNKVTRLKLYMASKINGQWGNIKELPFNDSNYSIAHPALNADDSELYFISDMNVAGSKGGSDIYKVQLHNHTFSDPINVSSLNTPGNELFPFIDNDNTIYFSSNGQIANLGGLDIYKASLNNGVYTNIENMGTPINSTMDDFAITINSTLDKGYFASNREIQNSDEVYSFSKIINDIIEPDLVSSEKEKERDSVYGLKLKPIHFDFDKSDITKSSEKNLQEIIALMKKYPFINLEIHGNTDIRSSKKYNQGLSVRRVQSTIDYLVNHGISKTRLNGKGYGENLPQIDCESKKCTQDDHFKNRRCEFKIVKELTNGQNGEETKDNALKFEDSLELNSTIISNKSLQSLKGKKIPTLNSGYYIISGVFKNHDNFKKHAKYLLSKGHHTKSFKLTKNNDELFYIYVFSSLNSDKTINKYNELKTMEEFKDIWIFKN